jgi:hypothetical protein
MMNNIISIDLDKLNGFNKYIRDEIKGAQVPTPCTLTDAVEKYGRVEVHNLKPECSDFNFYEITSKEEAQNFIKNHLYKEETLEDGIYEVEIGNSIQMVYVKDGKWCTTKNGLYFDDTHEFKNPRKKAEL